LSALNTPDGQANPESNRAAEPSAARRMLSYVGRHLPSGDMGRIVAVWFVWLAIVCTFQVVVEARVQPARPDYTLSWTQYSTQTQNLDCRAKLNDPFFNEHVAWDSEYYISIATTGYNDPEVQAYYPNNLAGNSGIPICQPASKWVSLNYAFMPGYPTAMKPIIALEGYIPVLKDQTEIGKAALAGVIVSALGGLLAMLALARLMAYVARRNKSNAKDAESAASKGRWGGSGGLRAAFYLLVFPTGFFLAQVYTEGLFVGLAFMGCAMAVEKRVVPAVLFGALAAIVRPTGVVMALPLGWLALTLWLDLLLPGLKSWFTGEIDELRGKPDDASAAPILADSKVLGNWRSWVRPVFAAAGMFAPVAVFLYWKGSVLGQNWQVVEDNFFGRKFDPAYSIDMWGKVVDSFVNGVDKTGGIFANGPLPSSTSVYLGIELLAVVLSVVASVWLLRKMPGVALFGLGIIFLSVMSSSAQGMDRYVLAVPAIFLMLASFGRHVTFDRAWVLGSSLLMGMLAMIFTYGFWVA
jgi:hypothetical protein